jgi:5-(carboxyamino)imidazole ribonucleotide synthase
MSPLPQGSTIGILGGGQLGRMLSVAAARLGYKSCTFDPAGDPPASHVANYHFKAEYEDRDALQRFGETVDVITFEFENIPATALDCLSGTKAAIHPGRNALRISQDRLVEKAFLRDMGLATAPFAAVDDIDDLTEALDEIGTPAILKTRRFGYDGKGQVRINTPDTSRQALAEIEGEAAILEGFVDFEREISVIGARSLSGEVACFDPGENMHRDGILRTTTVPARLTPAQRADAVLLTAQILNKLCYVGVMGVELFVTARGLVVNEIAPRVHNSGHWTQMGCSVDQFEQHIRAIAGWPLGDGQRHVNVVMENLIGADMARVPDIAQEKHASLHLYGKDEVKPGRKMGHVNRVWQG